MSAKVSNVSLTIGGRNFAVSCAQGQEAHVAELGRMVDERAAAAGGLRGQSEPRMLLLAALMLANDLHEAQGELALLQDAPQDTQEADRIAERAERIASRLEALAQHLEDRAASA